MKLLNAAVVGNEFALAWDDGEERYLDLAELRRACPCAACQGEPDALGRVIKPHVVLGAKSTELLSWDVVGGYALQPKWADGHSTGIYSFSYLRGLPD